MTTSDRSISRSDRSTSGVDRQGGFGKICSQIGLEVGVAKFFVGQRVRIVVSQAYPNYFGCETVIVAIDSSRSEVRYEVPLKSNTGYPTTLGKEDCFEPILPEGHKPSEFSFSELMDNLGVVVA